MECCSKKCARHIIFMGIIYGGHLHAYFVFFFYFHLHFFILSVSHPDTMPCSVFCVGYNAPSCTSLNFMLIFLFLWYSTHSLDDVMLWLHWNFRHKYIIRGNKTWMFYWYFQVPMATTACFIIVSRNDIPIYETELGSAAKVCHSSFIFVSRFLCFFFFKYKFFVPCKCILSISLVYVVYGITMKRRKAQIGKAYGFLWLLGFSLL